MNNIHKHENDVGVETSNRSIRSTADTTHSGMNAFELETDNPGRVSGSAEGTLGKSVDRPHKELKASRGWQIFALLLLNFALFIHFMLFYFPESSSNVLTSLALNLKYDPARVGTGLMSIFYLLWIEYYAFGVILSFLGVILFAVMLVFNACFSNPAGGHLANNINVFLDEVFRNVDVGCFNFRFHQQRKSGLGKNIAKTSETKAVWFALVPRLLLKLNLCSILVLGLLFAGLWVFIMILSIRTHITMHQTQNVTVRIPSNFMGADIEGPLDEEAILVMKTASLHSGLNQMNRYLYQGAWSGFIKEQELRDEWGSLLSYDSLSADPQMNKALNEMIPYYYFPFQVRSLGSVLGLLFLYFLFPALLYILTVALFLRFRGCCCTNRSRSSSIYKPQNRNTKRNTAVPLLNDVEEGGFENGVEHEIDGFEETEGETIQSFEQSYENQKKCCNRWSRLQCAKIWSVTLLVLLIIYAFVGVLARWATTVGLYIHTLDPVDFSAQINFEYLDVSTGERGIELRPYSDLTFRQLPPKPKGHAGRNDRLEKSWINPSLKKHCVQLNGPFVTLQKFLGSELDTYLSKHGERAESLNFLGLQSIPKTNGVAIFRCDFERTDADVSAVCPGTKGDLTKVAVLIGGAEHQARNYMNQSIDLWNHVFKEFPRQADGRCYHRLITYQAMWPAQSPTISDMRRLVPQEDIAAMIAQLMGYAYSRHAAELVASGEGLYVHTFSTGGMIGAAGTAALARKATDELKQHENGQWQQNGSVHFPVEWLCMDAPFVSSRRIAIQQSEHFFLGMQILWLWYPGWFHNIDIPDEINNLYEAYAEGVEFKRSHGSTKHEVDFVVHVHRPRVVVVQKEKDTFIPLWMQDDIAEAASKARARYFPDADTSNYEHTLIKQRGAPHDSVIFGSSRQPQNFDSLAFKQYIQFLGLESESSGLTETTTPHHNGSVDLSEHHYLSSQVNTAYHPFIRSNQH